MPKTLIVLMVGLLAVACLTPEQKQQPPTMKSVAGTYGWKEDGNTIKLVLLENGVYEYHFKGNKSAEAKWSIENKEIHISFAVLFGRINVYRINQDKSITVIANIDKDGKRRDLTKEEQSTYKKIK